MKGSMFYERESLSYSAKRYPAKSTYYVHYFFKKRLEIFETVLLKTKAEASIRDVLEIGCADGVTTESLAKIFPDAKIIAVDISEKMINQAKNRAIPDASFFLRGEEPEAAYDLVAEIGVLNLIDLEQEIAYINAHLREQGICIVSVAQKGSTLNFFKPFSRDFAHLRDQSQYKSFFEEKFDVIASISYGLFVPLLWYWPAAARHIQPMAERLIPSALRSLFHETIFVLKKKQP
jgi:SAM-dependent methyltransferase